MLLCIPTHVRAARDDPELARAWCALITELRRRRLADASDVDQANRLARWRYLCSTPYAHASGAIVYLHVFRHECHPATDAPVVIGIPAERSWWPDRTAELLSLPRSPPTAALRLVS